ncbi:hypothetical protein SAMN05421787_101652 [Virgibacillus pantothenticus]|uniref:Uncharacterized protein n=1 Tax=Virgibacillus chiguensis TaxID=411959 RepID=A0A1M5NP89_9BACI|nr:hypothetical protein SAMN05421807_102297 [Virgibacillus chiguensis]SIS59890.1 hypothetical protein SAMN05421787_101652 [Virgibacillus pantothenticus]
MKNKTLCGIFLVIASLIGYRLLSDYMEETRDFR